MNGRRNNLSAAMCLVATAEISKAAAPPDAAAALTASPTRNILAAGPI
jgi:hypothetical protein